MNPLFAIRQAMPAFGVGGATAVPGRISAAELQNLGAGGDIPKISPGGSSTSFSGALEKMVNEVNGRQLNAGQAVHDLQNGQNASLHQTMIALEEASVSFQLMVEVRNKVLESYQELMRMQV